MITQAFLTDVCTHTNGTLACIYKDRPNELGAFVEVFLDGLLFKLSVLSVVLVVCLIALVLLVSKIRQGLDLRDAIFDLRDVMPDAASASSFVITLFSLSAIVAVSLTLVILREVTGLVDQILLYSGPLEVLVFQKL